MERSATQVALQFVEAINAHDVERLFRQMTPDHDGGDATHKGAEQMRIAWETYLSWFPDYRVEVRRTLEKDNVVALFGMAYGTYAPDGVLRDDASWSTPAAWEAETRGGEVAVWRVYADVEPMRRVMEEYASRESKGGD